MNPSLTDFQWNLLEMAAMTTVGFGDRMQDHRGALETQGLIRLVGRNEYRATPSGVAALKARKEPHGKDRSPNEEGT